MVCAHAMWITGATVMNATRTLIYAGVAALVPALAMAQVNGTNQGYLVDQNFNVVTAVGGTVCVRTSDWTPARAAAAEAAGICDKDLVRKPVASPTPPAPAPKKEAAKPPAKK